MSDNTTCWWDNTPAAHLGFRPQDSSEALSRRAARRASRRLDRNDPATIYQGGAFVRMGPSTDRMTPSINNHGDNA